MIENIDKTVLESFKMCKLENIEIKEEIESIKTLIDVSQESKQFERKFV